jgi:hypothetical protein
VTHWIPELSVTSLRPVAESSARRVLAERLDETTVDAVLSDAWARYRALEPEIPDEHTIGAGVMVHLSAWVIGIYRALVAAGLNEAEAREWTARANWPIYQEVAAPAWKLAGLGSTTPLERARRTMRLFFCFPYAAPGYAVEEVDAGDACFGFDVHRCAMADFFAAQGLEELCQKACCDLDFPLADSWGTRLEVRQTISRGANRCTFRFFPAEPDDDR